MYVFNALLVIHLTPQSLILGCQSNIMVIVPTLSLLMMHLPFRSQCVTIVNLRKQLWARINKFLRISLILLSEIVVVYGIQPVH